MPNVGDIGLVREFVSAGPGIPGGGLKRNTIVEILVVSGTELVVESLLPYNSNRFILNTNNFHGITYNRSEILGGAINSYVDDPTSYTLTINPQYSRVINTSSSKSNLKISDSTSQLTFAQCKALFKYIPVVSQGYLGFYSEKYISLILDVSKINPVNGKVSSEYKFKKITEPEVNIPKFFSTEPLLQYCKFKVKSYEESAKLFRNKNAKKAVVGLTLEASRIELQVEVKNSTKLEDTIYLRVNERGNQRFLLSDIEIIYPGSGITNINGIAPKKDRRISSGSNVRVVNNKHLGLKRNAQVVTENIKTVSSFNLSNGKTVKKEYLGYKHNNKIVYADIRKFKLV